MKSTTTASNRNATVDSASTSRQRWRIVAFCVLALFVYAYASVVRGPFVWDDRFLPFSDPELQQQPFLSWINGNRPVLMASFWVNYRLSRVSPGSYHLVNIILHCFNGIFVTLALYRILELAGEAGERQKALAAVGGAIFLLHPLQTESVSYVSSRSEVLSVFLYLLAYILFLFRPAGPVRFGRIIVIGAVAAAALATKEHTLTLVGLMMLTDLYWNPLRLRENAWMYCLALVAGAVGAFYVWRVLSTSQSAGFGLDTLTPATYFFTQCVVIWRYIGLFIFPLGQNLDTQFAVSKSFDEAGTIFGLIGLAAIVAGALVFRKQYKVASFGIFVFLLLIAPTSSVIPITDVVAERRMYLPLIGLIFVVLGLVRSLRFESLGAVGIIVALICTGLTESRNELWASPIALWTDTTEKSPEKLRPRFQLGLAYYEAGNCVEAARHFGRATRLEPPSQALLINLGVSLGCSKRIPEALRVLSDAQKINPRYDMVYVYRGDLYKAQKNVEAAAREYRQAIDLNPANRQARAALAGLERKDQQK